MTLQIRRNLFVIFDQSATSQRQRRYIEIYSSFLANLRCKLRSLNYNSYRRDAFLHVVPIEQSGTLNKRFLLLEQRTYCLAIFSEDVSNTDDIKSCCVLYNYHLPFVFAWKSDDIAVTYDFTIFKHFSSTW